MSTEEIYNHPTVKDFEEEILTLYGDSECVVQSEDCDKAIAYLLGCRKESLDRLFKMDDNYKQLLHEFNDCLRNQLMDMREKVILVYNSVRTSLPDDYSVEAVGKCFLSYQFPEIHPAYSERYNRIWELLNGTISKDLNPRYHEGLSFYYSDDVQENENQMLYLNQNEDNWNMCFDKSWTDDMNIIYPVYNLCHNMNFAILDLLWIRNFHIEIQLNVEYRV